MMPIRKLAIFSRHHWSTVNTISGYVKIIDPIRWTSTHMSIFNRSSKLIQRERIFDDSSNGIDTYDYIRSSAAERLIDRMHDMTKDFPDVAEIGCNAGYLTRHELPDTIKRYRLCDSSEKMLKQAKLSTTPSSIDFSYHRMDEETPTFEANSLDMVVSNLTLHWVNNLPGCFDAIFRSLKPDGLFMATIFGGDTLYELRSSLQLAELERKGGLSAHISPFAQISDVGSLLQRAGFGLLTIDTDEMSVGYPSMIELMYDLKGMGENNATYTRPLHLSRDVIAAATAIYNEMYGYENGVVATYHLIHLVGWKPAPNQPKPLERGSAKTSLKDLGNVQNIT